MKTLIISFFILNFILLNAQISLESLRLDYPKVISNKELCQSLILDLEKTKIRGAELAYLGALQTIWANHLNNPFQKLSTFKKGKKNIEKAVELNPDNLEVRFLRLSIQHNSPKILGYNNMMKEDKDFIVKNFNHIKNKNLEHLILSFFKDSDLLSQQEIVLIMKTEKLQIDSFMNLKNNKL